MGLLESQDLVPEIYSQPLLVFFCPKESAGKSRELAED